MKLLTISFFSLALVLAADSPGKAPAPVTIPASAVKADDGSYHYTDPQGTKWIYRKTPFGIARFDDLPAPAEVANPDCYAGVKATEHGDAIRFERPGPFGTYKWERKKTELDEMEQAVWNREKAKAAEAPNQD